MTWFKVDDGLAFHVKALRAGNTAMGMWVRAGAECAKHLTDGFVSDELAVLLGGHALARKLVAAELWVRADGGYQFHQWSDEGRQPTRAQVERDRKAAQLRKERWKERQQNADPDGVPDAVRNAVPDGVPSPSGTRPTRARIPTRPDPTRPEVLKSELAPLNDPTGQLLADHVNAYLEPPPLSVQSATKVVIQRLIAGGTSPHLIADGLAKMRDKRLSPRQLPDLVAEVTPTRATRNGQPSTADQRVAQAREVAARYRAQETGT